MSSSRAAWNWATSNRQLAISAAVGAVVLGVLMIAIGAILDWGWTRIVGAGLISMGAAGTGVLIGWSDPIRPNIARILSSSGRTLIILLAVIMVAPLLAGLTLMFAGAIIGGTNAEWYLLFIGVLITIAFLVLSGGMALTAISLALKGLWRSNPDDAVSSNGRDGS